MSGGFGTTRFSRSLVLACREEAARFPELSREAFAELREATGHMEDALSSAFAYDKINYLMLMMVDRHVHYHVIPRYSEPVSLAGRSYPDEFWPGPPDITHAIDLPEDALAAIRNKVRVAWPS